MENIRKLFEPRSVALIGASSNPEKYAHWTAKALIENDFRGDVFFVSNTKKDILGITPYGSILEIEAPVDLAVIAIAPRFIVSVIEECGRKGVAGAVIVSTGFGEVGGEGKIIETELKKIAQKYHIRLIGPNSMGIFNAGIGLNTSIVDLVPGDLALVAQSGNFGADINFNLKLRNLGYGFWATIGNQIDIRFHEILRYIREDDKSKAVLLYMEGLRVDSQWDGGKFLKEARKTSLEKPVVAIKIGRTEAGARAAASHTGSLAGSDQVFDAAFRQAGIIRVNNTADLVDLAEGFRVCEPPRGNRVAILTDGGGHGVMATDDADRFGLTVPLLSDATMEQLREVLPERCPIKNPVDLAGTPEGDLWVFTRCMEILLADVAIDGLVIVGFFGGYALLSEAFAATEKAVAQKMIEIKDYFKKPVVMHSIYLATRAEALTLLSKGGVPVYPVIEPAMKVMGALNEYQQSQQRIRCELDELAKPVSSGTREQGSKILQKAMENNQKSLLEPDALDLLGAHGIPVVNFNMARNQDEAVTMSGAFKGPLAMKIVSGDVLHKTDAGGVKLNISGGKEAGENFTKIVSDVQNAVPGAKIEGVLIAPMAQPGLECIIGASRDETFGPTIMFGLGGIFVEILKDVAFRVAPLSRFEATAMIYEIKGHPLFKGYRGTAPVDVAALADLIVNLSHVMMSYPEIDSIDLNPVIVYPKGLAAVDARVILTS